MRRPRVLLLSRDRPDGPLARRARELARRTHDRLDVHVVYRRAAPPAHPAPDAVYVFDAVPHVLAPALRLRARGAPVVLELGDAVADLLAALGRSRAAVVRQRALEWAAFRLADALVARGHGLADLLRERGVRRSIAVLPDGVDVERFRPSDGDAERLRLGLEPTDLAVGVVGSVVWSPLHRIAYGWELVEALPHTPPSVKAVVVGDGDGVARHRQRAQELGVADRLVLVPRVDHERLPALLAAFDTVTWTQTPDAVGRSRTTAKLPEYLACGKFVLASDVGEARRSVDGNGLRLAYRGGRDPAYVAAVAAALRELAADRALARAGLSGRARARRFDYDRISAGFAGVVEDVLRRGRR